MHAPYSQEPERQGLLQSLLAETMLAAAKANNTAEGTMSKRTNKGEKECG